MVHNSLVYRIVNFSSLFWNNTIFRFSVLSLILVNRIPICKTYLLVLHLHRPDQPIDKFPKWYSDMWYGNMCISDHNFLIHNHFRQQLLIQCLKPEGYRQKCKHRFPCLLNHQCPNKHNLCFFLSLRPELVEDGTDF